MKALALVALVGCGRIGFDASSLDAGDATSAVDTRVDIDGPFAGCTRDTFDTLDPTWDIYGDQPVMATGTVRIDLEGAMGDSNGLQRLGSRSLVGWTTIVQIVQPCLQTSTFTGMGWHPDAGNSVHISITQNEIRLDLGESSGVQDEYDPLDDRWLRLRESGGLLFGATSPDGATWNEFGSVTYDATSSHTDLGVDSPFVTVNEDFAVFDDYIECPP